MLADRDRRRFDAVRGAVAAAERRRRDAAGRAAVSVLRLLPRAGVQARDGAVLRQPRARGPQRARSADRRLHVRQRAARAALRHSQRHRPSVPARDGARLPPRHPRPRQHPDADVGRRSHLAGDARQVGDGSAARLAAAAAARRTCRRSRTPRPPPAASCCRCASGWRSIAAIRRARRATASSIRSAWRSTTSTSPASGGSRTTACRSTPTGELYDGTKIDGPAALRDALLKHKDAVLLSFTERLMTYALGRRVEPFDMPAVRAIVRDAAQQRLPDVVVHPRRRRRAPRSSRARRRQRRRTDGQALTARIGVTDDHHVHQPARPLVSAATVLQGDGRRRVALPLLEAMVPARAVARRRPSALPQAAARRHRDGARLGRQHRVRPAEEPVVAGGGRARRSISRPSVLQPARALPPVPHHRQQHRRAQRRGVHRAGDRRRSLPIGGGVPDAVASASDAGLGSARPGRRSISSSRRSSARRRRSRRCSCASRTSIRRAAASTATRAPTPTRSAGRRRASRCRWCATRGWSSISCSASARPPRRARRGARRDRSILDWVTESANRLNNTLGAADRARLDDYLDDVREVERRIQKVEAFNSERRAARACPSAPIGVPDSLRRARQADVRSAGDRVRVGHHARVRVQDEPRRVEPRLPRGRRHHRLPHRVAPPGSRRAHPRVREDQPVPRQPAAVLPRAAEEDAPTATATCSRTSAIVYGSPMGNSNVHNHKRCPLLLAGHAGGELKGNLHLKAADGTPMANVDARRCCRSSGSRSSSSATARSRSS